MRPTRKENEMVNWDEALKTGALAKAADEAGIARVEVLHGHTSMETAYLQPDYPYGGYRCMRRVWLEQAIKGAARGQYRLVTQTTNPRVPEVRWNKPHPGTYSYWAVLLRLPHKGEDFLDWIGCGIWGPNPAKDVVIHASGVYEQLNDAERKAYDTFVRLSHKGGSRSWEHWETQIVPAMRAYHNEHGTWPDPEDSAALGKTVFLAADEYPAAIAAAMLSE
jgi:hypothetical protein